MDALNKVSATVDRAVDDVKGAAGALKINGGKRQSRRQSRKSRREETAPMRRRQHKGGKSRRQSRKSRRESRKQ